MAVVESAAFAVRSDKTPSILPAPVTNLSLTDLSGQAGYAFLVDPAYVKLAYLQGNDLYVADLATGRPLA